MGAVLLASMVAAGSAFAASGDPLLLRGEVVETACFVAAGRRGEKHKQCAIACARAGQPLGILDDKTKTLYIEALDYHAGTPKDPLLEHIAAKVEVRGISVERGGVPAIVVHDVKRLSP